MKGKQMDEAKYKYEYFLSQLADGSFDSNDKPLRKLLNDGWKPIRETPVGEGYVLFVLSKKLDA